MHGIHMYLVIAISMNKKCLFYRYGSIPHLTFSAVINIDHVGMDNWTTYLLESI